MALFGQKRGMFDAPPMYGTPGIGDDIERRKRGLLDVSGDQDWLAQTQQAEMLKQLGPKKDGFQLGATGASGMPQTGGNAYTPTSNAAGVGGSFQPQLPDFSREEARTQLPDLRNQPAQPGQPDPRLMALVGDAPQKPGTFWQGGGKFKGRDALAAALAVMGDAFSGDRVGKNSAADRLTGARSAGASAFDKSLEAYAQRRRLAGMPGMTERELQAAILDPKAWAGSMSSNATSKYGAATLNPGDQRYLGDGNIYQAPTRGQQYAKSLGFNEGTNSYSDAIRDQELGANGPTAFGNQQTMQNAREAQAIEMERLRQQGRIGMEGVRQGNRMDVRGTPTYRDQNPPARQSRGGTASRAPTATGADGKTIYYRGGKWVDAQGRPVQ